MATQPNRKKNGRTSPSPKGNLATDKRRGNEIKDEEESRKEREERDKKEEVAMPDMILRRKSRRNRDLRQLIPSGCTVPWGAAEAEGRRGWPATMYESSGPQSLYEHTPLSKHGGTVMDV